MATEDNGTKEAEEKGTAVIYETGEQHSPVPRAISGIAIVGLVLAGIIGVWTWQSGSEATSPNRNTAEESTVAISTGAASQDHDVVSDEPASPPNPPAYSTRAPQSGNGSSFSNVAPLGQDPYLPPNAWNGQQNIGLQPSETIVAEGLESPGQAQQPQQPQVPPQSPSTQQAPQVSSALPGASQAEQPGTTKPGPVTETGKATDGSAEIPFPTDGFPLEPSDSTKTAEPQRGTDEAEDPKKPNSGEASDGPTDTTAGPKPKPRDER